MGTRGNPADLDRLLDRLGAGEEPGATGDLAPFLHPAQVARAALVRSLDREVAAEQLAALRIERARGAVVAPPVRRRGTRAAVAAVLTALLLVLGAGSAIAASGDALPGDPLYGVKRAVERISLAMHRDPVGRTALHLRFADIRLHEVAVLVAEGKDVSDVVGALEAELEGAEQDALHALALGQDADALLAHVREMIAKHIGVLNTVLGKVPDQAKDAVQRAITNATKAQDNVQQGRINEKANPQPSGHGKPTAPPGKGKGAPAHG